MVNSIIIGQGTLPVQCANIFAKSAVVSAVCSPDSPLREWANTARVPHFSTLTTFAAFAEAEPFDYLFSIVNYKVLPQTLLRLPRRMAINYHDGPLPRYGGVYATTWALMAGETTHGITWHVMTDHIDAGDIVKQVTFLIAPQDTAYKLNLKCYYTAIDAFRTMLPDLISGRVRPEKQDLSQRSYFGYSRRPANDCLLSFAWPAIQIDAFCRALDFENARNPIGTPKVIIGGRLLVCRRIELTNVTSSQAPGTVIESTPMLQVATSTEDIVIPALETIRGRQVSLEELMDYGLQTGLCIHAPDLSLVTHPDEPG